MPLNPTIRSSDYICRVEKGGCGRRIALVSEAYRRTCEAFSKEALKAIAVHVGEVGGRPIIKARRPTLLQARRRIEDSCAARAESGIRSGDAQKIVGQAF